MDDSPDPASSVVLSAAEMVGLTVSPADLPAVTAHLALLRGFAAVVGAPEPEPGPVFRP